MYTIEELTNAATKQFGLPPFLVKSALQATGKEKFSLEEARLIISAFAEKQVNR